MDQTLIHSKYKTAYPYGLSMLSCTAICAQIEFERDLELLKLGKEIKCLTKNDSKQIIEVPIYENKQNIDDIIHSLISFRSFGITQQSSRK